MVAGIRARWHSLLNHPIVRLEIRRIRRKRWWPGRRFFLFYPVLLGVVLGHGVALALGSWLEGRFAPVWGGPGVQLAALVTGVPLLCLLNVAASLLAFALQWIAPAITAPSIARERELGTLDLLRVTTLTERSIVLGKLGGCLARLWPGILTLALLTPFRVAWVAEGGLVRLSDLVNLAEDFTFDVGYSWAGLFLLVGAGALRPWGDLALHTAVGLFVSALCRSAGMAVAVSYGAVIAVRMISWMGQTLFSLLGTSLFLDVALAAPDMVFMAPTLVSLSMTFVEFAGAVLLVWAAIWWLKR